MTKLCVIKLCVTKFCVKNMCKSVCDEARGEGGGEEADGIQNQKQKTHTHTQKCGKSVLTDKHNRAVFDGWTTLKLLPGALLIAAVVCNEQL